MYLKENEVVIAGGIHRRECLRIGHGNGGVRPCQFLLPRELDEDRTFFKVILTTTPADFTMFPQTNPLDAKRSQSRSTFHRPMMRSPAAAGNRLERFEERQRIAREYQKGEFAREYFSVTFCVDQTKV